MIKIHNNEAWEWMNSIDDEKWDMVFMDPPDNLGLDYEGLPAGYDKRSASTYYSWLWGLIFEAVFKARVVWISYYHHHDLEIKRMVASILKKVKPSWEARTFIWRFNFGQYRQTDCANGYRPILRLSAPKVKWNCDAIRVKSERQKMGDPRAKGPKVPDDVFEFPEVGIFEHSRIQGNNKERRAWIPTQHPEALLERIVKLSLPSNIQKPKILELFTGSGTMIRVVKKLGIDLDTVELNPNYVQRLKEEHPGIEVVK